MNILISFARAVVRRIIIICVEALYLSDAIFSHSKSHFCGCIYPFLPKVLQISRYFDDLVIPNVFNFKATKYFGMAEAKSTSEGPTIGIELGTTYSCVALVQNGRVKTIPNEQGK